MLRTIILSLVLLLALLPVRLIEKTGASPSNAFDRAVYQDGEMYSLEAAQPCSNATGFALPLIDDNPSDNLRWQATNGLRPQDTRNQTAIVMEQMRLQSITSASESNDDRVKFHNRLKTQAETSADQRLPVRINLHKGATGPVPHADDFILFPTRHTIGRQHHRDRFNQVGVRQTQVRVAKRNIGGADLDKPLAFEPISVGENIHRAGIEVAGERKTDTAIFQRDGQRRIAIAGRGGRVPSGRFLNRHEQRANKHQGKFARLLTYRPDLLTFRELLKRAAMSHHLAINDHEPTGLPLAACSFQPGAIPLSQFLHQLTAFIETEPGRHVKRRILALERGFWQRTAGGRWRWLDQIHRRADGFLGLVIQRPQPFFQFNQEFFFGHCVSAPHLLIQQVVHSVNSRRGGSAWLRRDSRTRRLSSSASSMVMLSSQVANRVESDLLDRFDEPVSRYCCTIARSSSESASSDWRISFNDRGDALKLSRFCFVWLKAGYSTTNR